VWRGGSRLELVLLQLRVERGEGDTQARALLGAPTGDTPKAKPEHGSDPSSPPLSAGEE
jgi:hypothetical protein